MLFQMARFNPFLWLRFYMHSIIYIYIHTHTYSIYIHTHTHIYTICNELWNLEYLFKLVLLYPSDKYSEVEYLDHMVIPFLILLRNLHTVSNHGCSKLHFHQQYARVIFSTHLLQYLLFLFDDSYLTAVRWFLTVVLICIFLIISGTEHLFMFLLAIYIFFKKIPIQCSIHCLSWAVYFPVTVEYEFVVWVLYIF